MSHEIFVGGGKYYSYFLYDLLKALFSLEYISIYDKD